jgi:site-specific DNA recombinase
MELVMDKAITREEYDTRRAAYRNRQIEIENEMTTNRHSDDGFKDAMLLLLDLSHSAPALLSQATTERKRELLNFVFWNLQLEGETLCFDYRIPFQHFTDMGEKGKWCTLLEQLRTTPEYRQDIIDLADRIRNFLKDAGE